MVKSLVIFHKNCPSGDGFGSALAAWLKLGESAEYVAADYGDVPPDVTGKDVYILDLSFPPEVLETMGRKAQSVTLLDHHATAQRALGSVRLACCSKIHFDLGKCGAVLAWEHFHPNTPVPQLFLHLQDRDLWNWKHEKSEAFLAWLDTQPKTFERWSEIVAFTPEQLSSAYELGRVLSAQFQLLCESIASKPSRVEIAGMQGLMVNCSGEFRSEVGSLLAKKSGTFGLVWRLAEDGSVLCSLRSLKSASPLVDVEQISLKFGGGGHVTAASFKLSAADLPALAAGVIAAPPEGLA